MKNVDIPDEIVDLIDSLSKRARIVVEHILKYGMITTEELERDYGYNHPPRAARDVREAGIPLETVKVTSSDGRTIAGYKLGDLSKTANRKVGGRRNFPKQFKETLYQKSDGKCAICSGPFDSRYLQVDHRVPYEVSGDSSNKKLNSEDFMLVCGSCNRAKSWSCENCPNWQEGKAKKICERCYWANPEDHDHVALREVRRIDILWDSHEIEIYDDLKKSAKESKIPIPDYVKNIVAKYLDIIDD